MRDEPVPEIGADDVLIRVSKTGVCGTDLHIWNWDEWAQKTVPVPMVVGHEYAGVVDSIGSHVRTVKAGDRVSGEGHLTGMKSRMARAGHFHLDPETRGVGVDVPGAFAEYVRIPAFNAIHLPDEIDDEMGAILDPLGNAVHTALTYDLVGEDVLITGAGPIGIMAAAVCRHVGARHVVITDINRYRLELSAQVTDAVTVNVAEQDLRSVMAKLGMKEGFDIGLEMSGAPKAFDQMVDSMIMGGKVGHARHSLGENAGRLGAGDLQGFDHQGHLWEGDVRDLVQDDRHAAVGPRRPQGDHPSPAGGRLRPRVRAHETGLGGQDRAPLDRLRGRRTDEPHPI